MSTSQIYYLDMKGTSQVDYLDTKSTSQLESLKEVKDIYLGLSSSAKCYCVSHHQSTNSIIFTVQSYHTSSFRWLAWPRVACSPPCCGRYQGCWLTFCNHICVFISILLQAMFCTIFFGAAGKSFVSLWWCIAVYKRSGILQYGTSDKGGVYSLWYRHGNCGGV